MSRPAERSAVIVIGVGNSWRSDDGVGPAAIGALRRRRGSPEIDLAVLDGEPTRLIEAWRGRGLAVVIDAVVTGAAPGTVHRAEVGVDRLPDWSSGASSHSGGLADAIALADALDSSPRRLLIFGVEPASTNHGGTLSPVVAATLPTLVDRVLREVTSTEV